VLTVLALGAVGSVVGFGVHLWLEPWTATVALAAGSMAGLVVSHAFGESVLLGLALGGALTALALGVRAFASIMGTLQHPPSMVSPRVWFSR
jgi:hypothetical protein